MRPLEEKKSCISSSPPPFALNKAVSLHEEKNDRPEMDFSKLKSSQTLSKGPFPIVAQLQVATERKEAEELLNSVLQQVLSQSQTPISQNSELDRND